MGAWVLGRLYSKKSGHEASGDLCRNLSGCLSAPCSVLGVFLFIGAGIGDENPVAEHLRRAYLSGGREGGCWYVWYVG